MNSPCRYLHWRPGRKERRPCHRTPSLSSPSPVLTLFCGRRRAVSLPLNPHHSPAPRRSAAFVAPRAAAASDDAAPIPGLATAKSGNSFAALQDIEAIQKVLPHRFPFLLVDRVVELEPQVYAVGYKNVTANDNFFTGHFPDRKIMPGKGEGSEGGGGGGGERERERERTKEALIHGPFNDP